MKIVFILLLLISAPLTHAQDALKEKIDSIVNSKLGDKDPGLMVGIVKDGAIYYENYKGLASLQHQVKITDKTRSNIASTAKQFTALMVLQLSYEQKLSLEDDIRKYLPNLYPAVKEKIKIRHLINHTSGIRDYSDLLSIKQEPWWRQVGMDNDDVIEDLLEKQEDLAFEPGSMYMYSNSGYTVLTKVIEVATGEKFHDYSEQFFKDLGMNNTTFLKNYMYVIPNQALPYSDWGDGVWQQYPMITNHYGDGFLFTSLKDQLIFEQAVQNAELNNNKLLIESQKPIPNSEYTSYGFGLELEDRLSYPSVHHSGGTGSFHSQTIRFPEEKLTVFVMSNNSRLWSGAIADEIAKLILPEKEEVIAYDDRLSAVTNTIPTADLMGQYLSPKEYLIRIVENEGQLAWRNGNNNPIALKKEDQNVYSLSYNSKMKIGFYENELILFYPSGKVSVYKKIPKEEVTLADLESYVGQYYSRELDVAFSINYQDEKLTVSLHGWDDVQDLEVLNRNELLVFDYILKIQRDQFNRVTGILLTTNRVLNNKFVKKTNLKFQPKIETENGSIQVTTIGSRNGESSDILLTKNYPNGNEIWYKQFGGKSYDKASSILETEDGYLIIGSTSSYGNGNYDMLVIKTDKQGNKLWQNTYGDFFNEYGYSAEETATGFLIKGTIQNCDTNDLASAKCTTNVWFVNIDQKGKELSRTILEEFKYKM
ncbi:serine hydrolase domain-containing protein [Psychroserpens sp.]|uniref:serine hydrolase domain-containing protein n=1 Tax=Psychroserpens sp. TaxID=2020870 RepID=UPI001B17337A|nr:serine hydrolase domain-containing protein [Psychroserpens sp.]MBO6605521.1 beta-lactamase family protein [Psychroserpens sp.]MBO6630196.1 beta-lactamase family protein [Psychroserpens sp.]MBO6653670.1 beta-lactamase family protein [Psychroserpens sp.]MBO6681991.1 beta-lactamase family protein [Psychroserpens sp.]MBO6748895.1 beta-lactamase family protein [Psychroserpens sp.]